jgi:hypothetical protein
MKVATSLLLLFSLLFTASCAVRATLETDITEISLGVAGCADDCPRFRATLFSDGRVEYFGEENAPFVGKWTASIPVEDFALLARLVNEQHYFTFLTTYGEPGTHFGPVTTSVLRNGVRKTVVDHGYNRPQGPLPLQWIEAAIEVVLRRAENWTKTD